jgi:dihydrolipoamide dehydrogenase
VASHDPYDLLVIGGGPGGYVAAIRAAQLGLRTAAIEREHLGGICLNWGCIPTKALLRNAELYRTVRDHGAEMGLVFDTLSFDLAKIVERSRKTASRLSGGIAGLFRKHGVEHIKGTARLAGQDKVSLLDRDGHATTELQANHIIVATGARARQLPFAPFDGERVLSYKEAMVPATLPASLCIIGAGAIGVEFAYFYRAFGVEVTLVEAQDRIVPVEDHEVSAELDKSFRKMGIRVLAGRKVAGVDTSDASALTIDVEHPDGSREAVRAERLLVAVGIQGNIENIGLEEAGVTTDRGFIQTDRSYRTSAAGIYAIGDVAGPPWLAHKASAEGICAVERIAGHERPDVPYASIPGCTYCQPEIASVGQTEQALEERGIPYNVGRFPYRASGKAMALGEETGFVKVLTSPRTGELLGAHIIGHGAPELIHELTLAHTLELRDKDILHTVHAHPTLSESIHEAIAGTLGEMIHF